MNDHGEYYDHWELYAMYSSDERHDGSETFIGGLVPINHIYCPEALDVALCWLNSIQNVDTGSFLEYPQLGLTARFPRIGENIIGCGYYGSRIETTHSDEKVLIDYDRQHATTRGIVTALHPEGRDASMLNFPCFRTDTRFEPGMSGGPIFGEDGFVCGIICSSMAPTEDDPTYLSYGSLMRPAFGIQMEAIIEPNTEMEKMLLYDFAKRGHVLMDKSFARLRLEQ